MSPTRPWPPPPIEHFKALNKQIFVLEPSITPSTSNSNSDPTTIVLYGWGSGEAKNVGKYAVGYHALFPNARIVVVLVTLPQAMFGSIPRRMRDMQPVLDAAFPPGEADEKPRMLVQVMSNSGISAFVATLLAFRARFSGKILPHSLLVLDSCPGGRSFFKEVWRWSSALTIPAPSWLPAGVVRAFWLFFLTCASVIGWVTRIKSVGLLFRSGIVDPKLTAVKAKRLYIYSKADQLVGWRDVEEHIADSRREGYDCSVEVFEGSEHVSHMRMFPERYWGVIKKAWDEAMAERGDC
jgi:hypothetical protein